MPYSRRSFFSNTLLGIGGSVLLPNFMHGNPHQDMTVDSILDPSIYLYASESGTSGKDKYCEISLLKMGGVIHNFTKNS